ncbi:hypothetical protein AcV5_008372 [Taiwanofungus camphoratus]|nr:hypothetical protein AcV5_008372 [Antrodia cinnamomea]
MRRAISRRFGGPTSVLFVLLTCTQFHLPFWMGRTLPNMFALFPVNLGLYMLVNRAPRSMRPSQSSIHRAIILLTFTSAVFRSEVILLLGPLVLQSLICQWTTFTKVIKVGLIAGLFSAALTIGVDSYFWKRWPIWPELYSIYFNVIQGKSSEWGVSPFHTYFTSSLPKLLLSSLPLSLVGFMADSRVRALLLVPTTFLLLISGLSHKEWRFVVYTVPLFNIAAARGAAWMITRRKSTLFGRVCFLAVAGMLICNCLATTILTMASMENYPGGEALSKFNRIYATQEKVHVHISNLAAQTGASLFLHTHSPPYLLGLDIAPSTPHWTYNKTEHISPKLLTAAPEITHVIAEADAGGARASGFGPHVWTVVDAVDGFDKWMLNPNIKHLLKGRPADALDAVSHALVMNRSEKLLILERT